MRILIFGNSITQGFWDTEYGGWVNRLSVYCMQKAVESNYDSESSVFNLGISGEDIIGISERFTSEIQSRKGRKNEDLESIFIVAAVGVNDSQINIVSGEHRTEPEEYKKKLEKMVIYAKENCAGIALVGLSPIDDSDLDPIPWHKTHAYRIKEVEKHNDVIKEVAKANDVLFISLENIFGTEVANFTTDGIHPNAEGHQLIFERVKSTLEKEGIV